MKKKLLLLLVSAMALTLYACSGDDKSTEKKSSNKEATQETTTNDTTEETDTQNTEEDVTEKTPIEELVTESTLADMEQHLLASGVVTGEKTEVMASMIGATEGFKYMDSDVEVYLFDTESDAYKNMISTNTVFLEDFDMTIDVAAINGKFALLCDEAPNRDAIIAAFNSFNK